jgi:hypothetical protein
MFKQTLSEFFKSKSNWVGLTGIGWYTGTVPPQVAAIGIMGGLQAICVKDAIAKK